MGACGDLWGPVGAYGVLWGPAGSCEGLWGAVGSCWGLRGPAGSCGGLWGAVRGPCSGNTGRLLRWSIREMDLTPRDERSICTSTMKYCGCFTLKGSSAKQDSSDGHSSASWIRVPVFTSAVRTEGAAHPEMTTSVIVSMTP